MLSEFRTRSGQLITHVTCQIHGCQQLESRALDVNDLRAKLAQVEQERDAARKERDAAHAHACEASLEERDLRKIVTLAQAWKRTRTAWFASTGRGRYKAHEAAEEALLAALPEDGKEPNA